MSFFLDRVRSQDQSPANSGDGVSVERMAKDLNLICFNLEVDQADRMIRTAEVNRPGLELTGYTKHFAGDRIQILGKVECSYLETCGEAHRRKVYESLLGRDIPCIIFCRDLQPEEMLLEIAAERNMPILGTTRETSEEIASLITYLLETLAPMMTIHGVLVDIYGEGVLIMGESGIGKSEAALELLRRGHRLVSDDVVEVRKVDDKTLMGTSPAVTQHFIELRGIGIVDVRTLFGVECVKERQRIDLVIQLEEWNQMTNYDRMGLEDEYTEILGVQCVCHRIPIRPGRNLAVICETASVNHRQKKMGYSAAEELYKRVQAQMKQD